MRPLNLLHLVSLLLSYNYVLAAPPSTSLSTSLKSETGSTGLTSSNSKSATSLTQSVDLQSGSKFSSFDLRLSLDRSKNDYSRYVLTDKAGTQTELAKLFDMAEHSLRLGTSIFVNHATLSIDGSQTVGQTPFSGHTAGLAFSQDLQNSGTKFLTNFFHSDHQAPSSYFVDPDRFTTRLRPNRNLENKVTIGAEQIINETAKLRFTIFAADKPGTRPLQRGGELALAQAINDSSALVATAGLAREKGSDPLYDDRGFLSANWLQIEYRLQPSYRFEFSAKLATIYEKESPRGRLPENRVGTDSFGLNLKSRGKSTELGAFIVGALSNTSYKSLSLGGNLQWNL